MTRAAGHRRGQSPRKQSGEERRAVVVAIFFENDAVAAFVVLDDAEERPHQHDAAAAGLFEVLVFGRNGHVLGAKAVLPSSSMMIHFLAGDLAGDLDLFVGVQPVAVT